MSGFALDTLSEAVSAFFGAAEREQQSDVLENSASNVRAKLMEVVHHFEWLKPWSEPNKDSAALLVHREFQERFPDLNGEAIDALVASATRNWK